MEHRALEVLSLEEFALELGALEERALLASSLLIECQMTASTTPTTVNDQLHPQHSQDDGELWYLETLSWTV